MMRLLIEIEVTDDVALTFKNGAHAMFVPMTMSETLQLGKDILLVHQGLEVLAASLNTFVAGREAQGKSDPEMHDAIVNIADHLGECSIWQSRVRETIGRAAFVNVFVKPSGGRTQ